MSFFKRKEKNLIPPVTSEQPARDELFSTRTTDSASSRPPASYQQPPNSYVPSPPPPSNYSDRYTKRDAVGDVYSRGQGNVDEDRNDLFAGYKPKEGSGRYFDQGPPRRPEPAPGEENEDDVESDNNYDSLNRRVLTPRGMPFGWPERLRRLPATL